MYLISDWFQIASNYVEKYQKERLQQESDIWQGERKKYLEELKEELKAMKGPADSSDKKEFLK